MSNPRHQKLAELICSHSVGIKSGDRVPRFREAEAKLLLDGELLVDEGGSQK